jgi:hypothetical protein
MASALSKLSWLKGRYREQAHSYKGSPHIEPG